MSVPFILDARNKLRQCCFSFSSLDTNQRWWCPLSHFPSDHGLQEGEVSTGCTTQPQRAADSRTGVTTSAGIRRLLLCFYRGKESQGARNRWGFQQLNPQIYVATRPEDLLEWDLMQPKCVEGKRLKMNVIGSCASIAWVCNLEVRLPETKNMESEFLTR